MPSRAEHIAHSRNIALAPIKEPVGKITSDISLKGIHDIDKLLSIDVNDPHRKLGALAPLVKSSSSSKDSQESEIQEASPVEQKRKHKHKHKHRRHREDDGSQSDQKSDADEGAEVMVIEHTKEEEGEDQAPESGKKHKKKHHRHHKKHKHPKQDDEELSIRMKSACLIQKVVRGVLARIHVRRVMFQKAKKAGVMLAMPGTKQGKSGWYQAHENAYPIYCEVDSKVRDHQAKESEITCRL